MRVSALILLEKQAEVICRKLPTTAAKKKSNLVFIKFFLLYLKRFFPVLANIFHLIACEL